MKNKFYTFLKSREGEIVPAINLPNGENQPLHSMIDPKKEAQRLVSTIGDMGFVIFLGLGGGFSAEAALELTGADIVVIDFNKDSMEELFAGKDYSFILNNSRFSLLMDPGDEEIKRFILENYKPALHGGIKTIPLRTRIEHDRQKFEKAAAAVQEAIEIVSGDYSVQAHFGKRWFSNIIRNIKTADTFKNNNLTGNDLIKANSIKKAAIAAAGPSLDTQLPELLQLQSQGVFIISTDTALGALLHNKIEPNAVVSIDCQHISYYHFMGNNLCKDKCIPLILDIASPPMLADLNAVSPVFFSSGHPLAHYICANWQKLPLLDTSGGNVTYACLSLAEYLGAEHITLFGADFSYVNSQSYARGTYIYPYFHKRQNRLSPLEAQFSSFLYRSPFVSSENGKKNNYYETSSLRFYRKKLEEKAGNMSAVVTCAQGHGAPINFNAKVKHGERGVYKGHGENVDKNINANKFLEQYKKDITALPHCGADNYIKKLNEKERQVFLTLLPYAAAIKKRNKDMRFMELMEEVKQRCAAEIDALI